METFLDTQRLELLRTKSAEEVELASQVLTAAGVPFHASSTRATFSMMEIGNADVPADLLVTVERRFHAGARAALENAFGSEPLPEDHFLHTASSEDILAMLASPDEWSSFDIGQARKLAQERNIDFSSLPARTSYRRHEMEQGKPAPHWLVVVGWISACFGGVFGVGIGYSIAYMKQHTPDADPFAYDAPSRHMGRMMICVSLVSMAIYRLLWVWYFTRR